MPVWMANSTRFLRCVGHTDNNLSISPLVRYQSRPNLSLKKLIFTTGFVSAKSHFIAKLNIRFKQARSRFTVAGDTPSLSSLLVLKYSIISAVIRISLLPLKYGAKLAIFDR